MVYATNDIFPERGNRAGGAFDTDAVHTRYKEDEFHIEQPLPVADPESFYSFGKNGTAMEKYEIRILLRQTSIKIRNKCKMLAFTFCAR